MSKNYQLQRITLPLATIVLVSLGYLEFELLQYFRSDIAELEYWYSTRWAWLALDQYQV